MLRVLAIVLTMAGLITFAEGQGAGDQLIMKESPLDVDQTTKRLQNAVATAGGTVFATIDHGAGAESINADLPPARVIVFGNPKMGTPLMQNNILIGLDLPMRILVWQDSGQTIMAYRRPGKLAGDYSISPEHPSVVAMADTLDKLTDRITEETRVNLD